MDWKKILKAALTPIAILIILPGLFLLLKVIVGLNLGYLSQLILVIGNIFVYLVIFGSPFILFFAVPFFIYTAIKKYELNWKSALILILVVSPFVILELGFLFWLGTGPPPAIQCTFPPGFTCVSSKLHANRGYLTLEMGQGTGHTIVITGINCTQNSSPNFDSNGVITYGSGNNITVTSGSRAIISDPNDSTKPWLNISCTDANGNLPSNTNVGTPYSGWIYVRYTEMDTNLTRTIRGTFTLKYEG